MGDASSSESNWGLMRRMRSSSGGWVANSPTQFITPLRKNMWLHSSALGLLCNAAAATPPIFFRRL